MRLSRREFLAAGSATVALGGLSLRPAVAAPRRFPELAGEVGITTSSIDRHFSPTGESGLLSVFEMPRFLRDELGMKVIDLNTKTLGSHDRATIERFRDEMEKAGLVIVNLKMNQGGFDINSTDRAVREAALAEFKLSIDDAAILGSPYARPLPLDAKPDLAIHVASYRELADYGAPKEVRMLVENYKWMEDDPEIVPKLVAMIGRDAAACPDTGNWANNEVRYEALAKAFPLAVTCDFKARDLGPNGEHELYDLKRCFQIGWDSGFRGPWCLEHAHGDRKTLVRELTMLRDMLKGWMSG
jgi:sugar phosphate isomerase/epimerase